MCLLLPDLRLLLRSHIVPVALRYSVPSFPAFSSSLDSAKGGPSFSLSLHPVNRIAPFRLALRAMHGSEGSAGTGETTRCVLFAFGFACDFTRLEGEVGCREGIEGRWRRTFCSLGRALAAFPGPEGTVLGAVDGLAYLLSFQAMELR